MHVCSSRPPAYATRGIAQGLTQACIRLSCKAKHVFAIWAVCSLSGVVAAVQVMGVEYDPWSQWWKLHTTHQARRFGAITATSVHTLCIAPKRPFAHYLLVIWVVPLASQRSVVLANKNSFKKL